MPFDGVAGARWQIDIMAADKTAQAFTAVDRRLKSLEAGVAGMGRGMAAGVQQTVAFGRGLQQLAVGYGVVTAAHKAFQAGLRIGDLGEQAEQLGVSTDQLQAYRLMAAQAGVTNEQLDASLLKLQNAMGAANDGSDEIIARFEKLGVKILDVAGNLRKPSDVLPELSRGLLKVGSDTERTAIMADLFGRSGARLKTMLEEWAQGNDRLVASARAQNAIAGPDAIKAWDELGDALKVAEQRYDTMIGTLGKPVALAGLNAINFQLHNINSLINGITKGWNWLTSGPGADALAARAKTLQGTIDAMTSGASGEMDDLAKARLQGLYRELGAVQQQIADQQTAAFVPTMPAIEVTATGARNPTGKTAAAAGARLDDRLKELQAERAALEKALAAFDVRGLDTVAEVDKRLDAQVKLDQKIASLLKDVPPNSALSQQFIQEATAISQLNARLDERKRLLTEAEQVTARFGDGSLAAARATADLNAMLAAGALDADTYARALKSTKEAAADQERTARGAMGGFDGFRAGMEQYGAEMQKANSAFEMGKFTAQEFGSVFTGLNQGLREGKDLWQSLGDSAVTALGRIADKLIEMAAQNLFAAAFGMGGGGSGGAMGGLGSLGGLFGGGSSGTAPGLFDGLMGSSFFPTFATGGIPPVGSPYIVGEKGPEVRVDGRPGQIFNRDQWQALAPRETAPAPSVVIHQTVMTGSIVSHAQHEADMARLKREARDGAVAAIVEARRTSASMRRTFR